MKTSPSTDPPEPPFDLVAFADELRRRGVKIRVYGPHPLVGPERLVLFGPHADVCSVMEKVTRNITELIAHPSIKRQNWDEELQAASRGELVVHVEYLERNQDKRARKELKKSWQANPDGARLARHYRNAENDSALRRGPSRNSPSTFDKEDHEPRTIT
jgi:hypothetical protein